MTKQEESKTIPSPREDYEACYEFQQCACGKCECGNIIDKAYWCCTYCAEVHHGMDIRLK